MSKAVYILGGVLLWEASWWMHRRNKRKYVFQYAQQQAVKLGKPLVVVGAPDGGITANYACGDITVDIKGSSCPKTIQADITKHIPLPDDSAVVFVSCVLEYVDDFNAALKELDRIGGKNVYIVRVEPWTLTAYLYPGAKRVIPELTTESTS